MKPTAPKFRVTGKSRKDAKVFLQCSNCDKDIREIKETDEIDVRRAYYCPDCDNGTITLNPANTKTSQGE